MKCYLPGKQYCLPEDEPLAGNLHCLPGKHCLYGGTNTTCLRRRANYWRGSAANLGLSAYTVCVHSRLGISATSLGRIVNCLGTSTVCFSMNPWLGTSTACLGRVACLGGADTACLRRRANFLGRTTVCLE